MAPVLGVGRGVWVVWEHGNAARDSRRRQEQREKEKDSSHATSTVMHLVGLHCVLSCTLRGGESDNVVESGRKVERLRGRSEEVKS